jgi:two-component system sensor histidine kinase AlgZ
MTSKQKPTTQEFFIPDLCNVQAVLFLVLVAELLAIVLELAGTALAGFSWESFALTSLFVQWTFLTSAVLLCRLRSRLIDWALHWAASLCYVVILAVVASASLIGQLVMAGTLRATGEWSIDYSQLFSHVLICAVLAGIALRYFYLTQQLRLRQRAELQARIQALQSRIRPHFLFNSMNIIASLIAVDQVAAETAVEDLAGLFRASLAEAETEVSLLDELELCRGYARIEQLRLGKRLQLQWQVDDVPASLKVPSLSLQPLLENAIYHGVQQLPEGGVVTIRAEYQQGEVKLSVINPMPQGDGSNHTGNRLAQDNIHQRLQAMYGSKAGLTTSMDNQQHCAVMTYPFDLNS